MKIISFSELMDLPQGIIFQRYEPHYLSDPYIFGGPIGSNDYAEAQFLPVTGDGRYWNDPSIRKKWDITEDDFVIHQPANFGRNGGYQRKACFLIWEEEDRQRMAAWLLNPEVALRHQNDDPHVMIKVSDQIRLKT